MLNFKTDFCELKVKGDEYFRAKSYQNAIKEYLQSLFFDKNDSEIYFGLGVSYKFLNKIKKAILALEKAVSLDKSNAKAFYELGICYLIDGQVCCAMQSLIKCIQLDKNNLDAQLQLGIAHEGVDEKDLALKIYLKIINTDPSFLKAYEQASFLLIDMKCYKQAGQLLNKIVKKFPHCVHAHLGLGICYENLGRKSIAKRCYKKFLHLSKDCEQNKIIINKLNKIEVSKNKTLHLSLVNG